MDKILIFKLGALGDVVRTTPLLRVLQGEITWVTEKKALPLLLDHPKITHLYSFEEFAQQRRYQKYDLILCLEENINIVALSHRIPTRERAGILYKEGEVSYSASARAWYDMSLISRLGRAKANVLKWKNRRSYPDMLFAMIGKKFRGEEYWLPLKKRALVKIDLGIESRSGDRWVAKRWPHAQALEKKAQENNWTTLSFQEYPTLQQFIAKIDSVQKIVTTDSLALHLALALGKPGIAIFNCTSSHEIETYGRIVKIASPDLKRYFYTTKKTLAPGRKISCASVWRTLKALPNPSA